MSKDKLRPQEAARYLGVCVQRVHAKLKEGHFPNARWCECGISKLIPVSDLNDDIIKVNKRGS